jgi:Uma2 family endonuclease
MSALTTSPAGTPAKKGSAGKGGNGVHRRVADATPARSIVIFDSRVAEEIQADRKARGIDRWDEVWDGVYVVPSLPNDEHQEIQFNLLRPLGDVVTDPGLGKVRAGVNVTDRHPNWKENFRCPDVVVYLSTTTAVNYGVYWLGGPDFLVEIVSPDEDPAAKFDFYAKVKAREVLVVKRDPWALELYRLRGRKMARVGSSTLSKPTVVKSQVVPLTFKLIPGKPRPVIEVVHPATGMRWEA